MSLGIGMDRIARRVARRYRYRVALDREHRGAYVEERVLDDMAARAHRLIELLVAERTTPVPEIIEQLAEIVVDAEGAERVIPF